METSLRGVSISCPPRLWAGRPVPVLHPDGSSVDKPKRDFHGAVSFEATDGPGSTATATVTIKVLARPG